MTTPNTQPPHVVTDTIPCEECGGHGWNPLERFEYEPCEQCGGKGQITYTHDLLAEAFHLASGRGNEKLEIRHLQAVIEHFRGLVTALMAVPDLAERKPALAAMSVQARQMQEAS